tara:strand:- start:241 stop:543 length:303 start_codon:yes stop_codon:yes gene_type:complete
MHTNQYIGKIVCNNGNKATADRIIEYIPGQWMKRANDLGELRDCRYVGYDWGNKEHKWCDLTGLDPMVANKIFSEDRMKYKAIDSYFDGMGMGIYGEYQV